MNKTKIAGLILIILGIQGMVFGGFSYYVDSRNAAVKEVPMSEKKRQKAMLPLWGGSGAVAVGALLVFVLGGRREETD